jgi:hypothetical protein
MAHMGIGVGSGENKLIEAAKNAISSPLLETTIDGARAVLINVTGGADISIMDINEAAKLIMEAADPDANIIFGAGIDESMGDDVRITVIATGFEKTPFPAREPARKPREIEHDRLFGSFGTGSLRGESTAAEPAAPSAAGSLFSSTGETPTFMGSSRPSMGVPGAVSGGGFQTGFSYQQQGQPQMSPQPQTTRPFQVQQEQPVPYGKGQVFQSTAPQAPYQPAFGGNGQATGGFAPVPQTQAMATDSHGVQGYLRRKK